MSVPTQLDRTHHFMLETFVARGHAPHPTEIAAALDVTPEEASRLLRDLVATGLPVWLQPGTDLIASCAPFNEVPTPYRANIDGRPAWFAQCGFEAMAMSWVFPGRTVQIDAPCPHCGEPLRAAVQDGVLELCEPEEMVCYVDLPFREWSRSWPDT
jgi:Alkylmercury lyase